MDVLVVLVLVVVVVEALARDVLLLGYGGGRGAPISKDVEYGWYF